MEDWADDLRVVTDLGVDQISTYPLFSFPYSDLGQAQHIAEVTRPDSHTVRQLLRLTDTYAEQQGYRRCAVWSWIKPDRKKFSSITRHHYIGFGPSAASMTGTDFYVNTFNVEAYAATLPKRRPVALSMPIDQRLEMAYWLYWRTYELKIMDKDFRRLFGSDVSLDHVFSLLFRPFRALGMMRRIKGGYEITRSGAYWIHRLQNEYSLSYINRLWGGCRKTGLARTGGALVTREMLSWLSYGFRALVLRQKLPFLFGLEISDQCNLDCFYCEGNNKGRYHHTYDQARKALDDAYSKGHRVLYFTGGEPMIWEENGKRLSDLVRFAEELGFIEIVVYTNGTQPLEIKGCKYIVTIDGPREIHNRIRSDSYDLILKHVRDSVTKSVIASITFTKANYKYLEQYVKEITETGLFQGISFNLLTHWPEIIARYGFSTTERAKLLDDIWNLKNQGYPIILSAAAYKALRNNSWKRPLPQIELQLQPNEIYTCCRDIENKEICDLCGYAGCAEGISDSRRKAKCHLADG